MAISVNVTETVVNTDVTNTDITVTLTEQTTNVELMYPGAQGAQGDSGVVNVVAPITNTGTESAAIIGLNQSALSLARTQIVGTAVTEAAGKALTAGTADYATTAGSATTASTATTLSGTIAPTQVTGTAIVTIPSGSSQTVTKRLSVNQTGTDHALTTTLGANSGADTTALNVVSSNELSSAVWVSGKERAHGTVKIAHVQPSSAGDADAAALSINLASDPTRGANGDITAVQGIFLDTYQVDDNSIRYGSTGKLLNINNAGVAKLVLNANGQLALPMTTSDGGLVIGGDVRLWRSSAKILRSDSTVYLQNSTANTVVFYVTQTSGLGPSAAAFAIQNDGDLTWGSGTTGSTTDTTLYRSAANTLKTDGTFIAATIDGGSA